MKRLVFKVGVHDNKAKKKALKLVSSLEGIEAIVMNMKEKKLTVIGVVDPVDVVNKLRKSFDAEILTVGPFKESEKEDTYPNPFCKITYEENECVQTDNIINRDYHNYYSSRFPDCRIEDNHNSCSIS